MTPSIINPGPVTNPDQNLPTTNLKIAYCNVQGFIMMSSMKGKRPIFQTSKLLEFQSYLHCNKPDIVIVNESWLNENINNNEIVEENFVRCSDSIEHKMIKIHTIKF